MLQTLVKGPVRVGMFVALSKDLNDYHQYAGQIVEVNTDGVLIHSIDWTAYTLGGLARITDNPVFIPEKDFGKMFFFNDTNSLLYALDERAASINSIQP